MVDYAPDSKAVEAQLRDAIRDTSFSDYNRVKLAVRLMGLFDVRNANLSEMKAVWDALQSIEDKALSPAHRTMAYIYFGRGLLDKAQQEAAMLVVSVPEPDDAIRVLLRCAFYSRYINDDREGLRALLGQALGISSQAGLQSQQNDMLALVKEWE